MQNQVSIKPGYKNIPHVGIIPEEWNFGNIKDNFNIIKNKNSVGINIPYLEIGDVNNKTYTYNLKNKDSVDGAKYVPSNVLLISTVRPNLKKITITRSELLVSSAFAKIQLENNYLFHYVLSDQFTNKLIQLCEGGTYPTVKSNYIYSINIALPSALEQEKISLILDNCYNQMIIVQNMIKKIELRNKGLRQKLLTGKKRLEGFTGNWSEFKIGDFSKEISTRNKENKNLIVLSCTKYNGLVSSLEYFGRKIYSDNLTTYKIVPINAFAYATNHIEEGSIGYQDTYKESLISPMYTVFETNNTINDFYLFKLLKTSHLIYEYQRRMEGSIDRRGGLRWKDFSKIKISIPGIIEQNAIIKVLNKATEQLDFYKDKLGKLELEKKGLMQQLLTGKTRV